MHQNSLRAQYPLQANRYSLGDAYSAGKKRLSLKLGVSFFLFGLINNVLYVIILSAALDLVPPSTPKGIIAFCNIAPALIAKLGWPYFLKGRIRYARRIVACCALSFIGMLVVAFHESLYSRLLGICIASFSSGLGEMTFLQLSTTYSRSVGGRSVGYFASGTGAAGIVGAFMWWELRGLGVSTGVGISAVLPFILPLAYFFLLPRPAAFTHQSSASYTLVPADDLETEIDDDLSAQDDVESRVEHKVAVRLSAADKWRLVKPMLLKYMLPLCELSLSFLEYTINQGVAPTLLFTVPSHGLISKIIHSTRDYYPLWQLVYQTTVFFSRSSISLGLKTLPAHLLPAPAIIQFVILLLLVFESAVGLLPEDREVGSIFLVFVLISIEGVCGGLAYVNVFYCINQEQPDPASTHSPEVIKQEREFKIGSIGFADSSGILLASILAVPTEMELCRAQVARGKYLCQGL
ncbi:batten's disease protein Cln3 [Suillus bovinus]|uniref:batten's disease protein Cln3 n=1 Tax=Suillus bovinus TaxID=48563 RepID=UPI001B87AEE1|nr:batten's disease protein Cln3 [Suillus bovinus]KAG2159284.1 batten's disease protein Cln3 [Suillus bovinus]